MCRMARLLLFSILLFTLQTSYADAGMTGTGMYYPSTDAGGYASWWAKTIGYGEKCHLGHDFNAPEGSDVYAITSGVVHSASMSVGGYGLNNTPGGAIVIEHKDYAFQGEKADNRLFRR